MQLSDLEQKHVLILGYGKEGKATENFLQKLVPTAKISIADQQFDPNYLNLQDAADVIVRSPGVNKNLIFKPYTTATNLFFSQVENNLTIGITGSKGKSTVASLIYHILSFSGQDVRLVGNIGQPMLAELLKPYDKRTIFVVELSSYQLDDIEYSPNIAVVTSLFPEHLDYHGSLNKYYQAKQNILRFANTKSVFVYNPNFPILQAWARDFPGRKIPFESKMPKLIKNPLLGPHNLLNLQGAITVVRDLGVADETIAQAIAIFKPLPHRLEFVGEFKGISFYDDAIATTPEATLMALESVPLVQTLILGGLDRGYNFDQLAKRIQQLQISNLVLFPDAGHRILKALKNTNWQPKNLLQTDKMEKAVNFAYKHTAPGRACLLSTASPSYNLWTNFEAKGDEFQYWIKKFT